MKATHCTSTAIAVLALVVAAAQSPAGVKVDTAAPVETVVAFRVAPNEYVCTNPSNALGVATSKIGSRQTFTVIDLSGNDLKDGDEVRIRYTPSNGKSSYWLENTAGIRRGHDGDIFKLKQVDAKYALVTATGKFVAPPATVGALGVSAKQEGAMLFEIVQAKEKGAVAAQVNSDTQSGASVATVPAQTVPAQPSTPQAAPATPAPSPAPSTPNPATP